MMINVRLRRIETYLLTNISIIIYSITFCYNLTNLKLSVSKMNNPEEKSIEFREERKIDSSLSLSTPPTTHAVQPELELEVIKEWEYESDYSESSYWESMRSTPPETPV